MPNLFVLAETQHLGVLGDDLIFLSTHYFSYGPKFGH